MSDSLIEQVRKVVGFQQRNAATGPWDVCGARYRVTIDFPALLAHLERMQAVVDAARKLREKQLGIYDLTEALAAGVDLDAALERMKP